MPYFDRINVSKGIDANKRSASKECDTCHYCFFLSYSFKIQPNVCSSYDILLMMSMSPSDITVFDYCCIISLISKYEAINFMQNADLLKK